MRPQARHEHLHLRDPTHRREPLREERLGVLVQRGQRHRRRGQRQEQNRRVRRIGLVVRGWLDAGRQLAQRLRDRRLHVLRGVVDVARQRKGQRDVRAAERARRRHRVDAGDRRELLLERRRDRRGHGLRARARQSGGHRDRRDSRRSADR